MRATDIPTCIIFCMHILPVIDLKDGLVVAARLGKRQTYKPLTSPLCPQSELLAVIRAYLRVFPFRAFYLADLNAIEENGNNHALIAHLLNAYTDISLWIDSGAKPFINDNCSAFRTRVSNVLGSETGISIEQLDYYMRKSDCILSLDYRHGSLLGNPNLLAQPSRLPQRIIVMNLDQVGSHAGPDLEHIRVLADSLPGKRIYAAGGVRNVEDLRELAKQGIQGALIASALHNKTITSEHLAEF